MTDYDPPVFTCEFAPTFHPKALPAEGDWIELGTVLEFGMTRGRQDDLDEFSASEAEFVIDNSAEDLDQLLGGSVLYDSDALPFTPIRMVCTQGPGRWVLWTGYTKDGFNPQGLRGAGTISVGAVDWMGWAATVEAPDSPWSAWAAYVKPKVWIRGYTNKFSIGYDDDPDGVAYNSAALWHGSGYDMIGDSAYPEGVFRASSGIVTQSPSPCFEMGYGVDFGGLTTGGGIAQSGVWMAAGWFKTGTVSSMVWGGSTWQVRLDGSGFVVAEVTVGAGVESDAVAVDHTDDVAHVWVLTVTSTGGSRSMRIETDLGTDSHSFAANAVSGGGTLNFRGLTFIDCTLGDFVYWDDAAAVAAVIADYPTYDSGSSGPDSWAGPLVNLAMWSSDEIVTRLQRIPRMCGVDIPDYQVRLEDDHNLRGYSAVNAVPSTLEACVRQVGEAYLGAAYVLRDGRIRVRDASFMSELVGVGESPTYDFDTVEALISDEDTPTWDATVTDNFTRASNGSIVAGNPDWQFGHTPIDGAIGVNSNMAYVSDASASEPLIYYQDLGRDVTVECDFASAAAGQGVVVRHSSYGNFVTITQGSGTVEVTGWVDGVDTLIGDTGADDLGTALVVTTSDDTITVQIDGGTVHEFTITEAVHMTGIGVGLAYTNVGVLPAGASRWDNFEATCTRELIRAVNRSRTGTRADRVVNVIDIDGGSLYLQDSDSIFRYGRRAKSYTNNLGGTSKLLEYGDDILTARSNPTIEVGELELRPWGNQELTDWVIRDLELERKVRYREALYRAGTEVIDADYRISSESWDFSRGVDWTVTLKLVPA